MVTLAYLDPGSGSALLGTIFALAGATIYSLKNLVYRLFRKGNLTETKKDTSIVIFSEGKNYYGTWKGIVDELIRRKVHFCYYTLDLNDPILKTYSSYKYAQLFDKEKSSSFVRLSKMQAKVCVSTTPNIGTPGYPMKRSPGIENLVHVYHSAGFGCYYRKGSLNQYDTVLMVADIQETAVRDIEKANNVPAKKVLTVGLPYLDEMFERVQQLPPAKRPTDKKIVVVAPSWGPVCCLKHYGIDFVLELAKTGYHVILRPHPQSYISEAEYIAKWKKATEDNPDIEWDTRTSPLETLRLADVLISDISGVRFDFAFLFLRPVISLTVPKEVQAEVFKEYEANDINTDWYDQVSNRLGRALTPADKSSIATVVDALAKNPPTEELRAVRDESLANIGSSVKAVVDALIDLAK